jgi:hypothetical protein
VVNSIVKDKDTCEFSEKDAINILLFSSSSKFVKDYLQDNDIDLNRVMRKEFKESCYNLFLCE